MLTVHSLLVLCLLSSLAHAWLSNPRTPHGSSNTFARSLSMNYAEQFSGRNLQIKLDGNYISYDLFRASSPSRQCIVYLPGLVREKSEAKSINLQALCKREDYTFLTADYFGVGRSEGKFTDATVTKWTHDTIALIEKILGVRDTKYILVGHGLGAWISFLIAAKRPDLINGIVGLSADPDFTEELLWKSLPESDKERIMRDGVAEVVWGATTYPITRSLIEDGRKNLLLAGGKDSIPITCPIRLIHALYDEEVPHHFALKLVENCMSRDASVVLLKGASHEMEGEGEFKAMRSMIAEVMAAFKGEFDLTSPGSG